MRKRLVNAWAIPGQVTSAKARVLPVRVEYVFGNPTTQHLIDLRLAQSAVPCGIERRAQMPHVARRPPTHHRVQPRHGYAPSPVTPTTSAVVQLGTKLCGLPVHQLMSLLCAAP